MSSEVKLKTAVADRLRLIIRIGSFTNYSVNARTEKEAVAAGSERHERELQFFGPHMYG